MKKVLRHAVAFMLVFVLFGTAKGQPWIKNLPQENDQGNKALTFHEIQKAFYDYWEPFHVKNGYYIENGVRKKAVGWNQFKRWEWFWENRVNPVTGEFPDITAAQIRRDLRKTNGIRNASGNWKSWGPSTSLGGYFGLGRLNCIGFSETDTNVFYVGSPSGGIWKTTDGGITWTVLNDNLDVLGVSDILVISASSTDNDTVFIATGDRDWGSLISVGAGNFCDNNSIGVYKSVDGGATWSATGLAWDAGDYKTLDRLLKRPGGNDTLYASGFDGVFMSTDGGDTWTSVFSSIEIVDMQFKPSNPDVIYGGSRFAGEVYVSTDAGLTWIKKLDVPDAHWVKLAVSPDEPDWVYAAFATSYGPFIGIYKSEDSGNTWTQIFDGSIPGNYLLGSYCDGSVDNGLSWYAFTITADPQDANTLFLGGINTWKSVDGGVTWSISSSWTTNTTINWCGAPVVHADKHGMAFQPGTNTFFECNDGGLYKTNDGGNSWVWLGNGLVTGQIYRLGVSQQNYRHVITGLQDNGTKRSLSASGQWRVVLGGDGMECLIDYDDENTQYAELPNGTIFRTTNLWYSNDEITGSLSGTGSWVTPFCIDPLIHTTLYAGYDKIWKTTDQGTTWTNISSFSTPTDDETFHSIAVAPSDPDTIYAATTTKIWATYNGGTSWTDITGSLPVTESTITYISVNSDYADTLWVSMGAYNEYSVFQSNDAGATWTDISSGLPEIPVMCVIQNKQNTSEIELYAGTDVGVYVKVGDDDWTLFSNGLPNVVVTELEIYYDTSSPNLSRIRAATYGRGMWESELYTPPGSPPVSDFYADNTNPVVGGHVTFTDMTINDPTSWHWTFTPATVRFINGTSATSQNPVVEFLAAGTYDVSLYTENANGNDTETKTGYITVDASPTYCSAGTRNGFGVITRVQMGTIDNSSWWTPGGYEDYTSLSTNIMVLDTCSLTVTLGSVNQGIDLAAWIDWNQDGDFFDTDEKVVCNADDWGEGTYNFMVPAHAKPGSTRMRIRTKYWNFYSDCGLPCDTTDNGEVEDYSVFVVAAQNTWEGSTSSDWTVASNWSAGMVPTGSFNVTIPTSPAGGIFPEISSSTTNAHCNRLTIESGATLKINGCLTVDSTLTNNAGTSGLVIGSTSTGTGSLITYTDDVDATVKRYLEGGKWHLIAAPVKSATAASLFMNHDPEVWLKEFLESSGTDGDWGPTITDLSTPMPLGKGFATWLETGKTGTATFEGKLNALDLSPSLSFTDAAHGYNLVGNPFPCAIDWDQGGWNRTGLDGSVWVYEGGSGYLTRNSHGLGSLTDGIIPAMQGFFVRTTASSATLTIPALARVHSGQLFYKKSKQSASGEEAAYVVFNASDGTNTDEVWIAFCDECTEDRDTGWDVTKFFGNGNEPELYVRQEDEKLFSVEALPPLNGDERTIALDFEAGKTGNHLLTLKKVYDLDGVDILLEDLQEGTVQNMIINPEYSFYAVKNQPPGRFLVHFNPNMTKVNESPTAKDISIYSYDKTVYIRQKATGYPAYVSVVDLFGRELVRTQLSSSTLNTLHFDLDNTYLVVKVISRDKVAVKKVFIR